MSSHHIVRDEQEPALIIAGPELAMLELVEPLLEWSPTIVVLEPCLETVLQWGIKIDVVVVESSKMEAVRQALQDQMPVKIITSERAEGLIDTAVYFLVAGKYQAVNVISVSSTQLTNNLETVAQSISVGIISNMGRTNYFKNQFKKWLAQGRAVSLIPTIREQAFETKGLAKNGDIYSTTSDGVVEVSSDNPFWLTQQS